MEHYFTNNINLKSEIRELPYTYENNQFSFFSDNGVFSKNKIDYASSLLVKNFLVTNKIRDFKDKSILDVGCGYGFIGIVLSKITGAKIDLIDINKRALHLTERNIKKNKVNNCTVFFSDCYDEVKNKYDYIVTNPPIRAGKNIVNKILIEAKSYLKDEGELWFIIHKDHGAKSMKKSLEEYYNIEIIEKNKGFYCFKAKIC